MPLAGGLPSGLMSLAATSAGMSCDLAIQHPSRLLRRQAGWQLAQQHQEFMLVIAHNIQQQHLLTTTPQIMQRRSDGG